MGNLSGDQDFLKATSQSEPFSTQSSFLSLSHVRPVPQSEGFACYPCSLSPLPFTGIIPTNLLPSNSILVFAS